MRVCLFYPDAPNDVTLRHLRMFKPHLKAWGSKLLSQRVPILSTVNNRLFRNTSLVSCLIKSLSKIYKTGGVMALSKSVLHFSNQNCITFLICCLMNSERKKKYSEFDYYKMQPLLYFIYDFYLHEQ